MVMNQYFLLDRVNYALSLNILGRVGSLVDRGVVTLVQSSLLFHWKKKLMELIMHLIISRKSHFGSSYF